MTKKDLADFGNSIRFKICDIDSADGNVKIRDHCHITGKYRGPACKDCNIKVNLNHKFVTYFTTQKMGFPSYYTGTRPIQL